MPNLTRRNFVRIAATSFIGARELGMLATLTPATAEQAHVPTELVRFTPDLEPVVRLIENTPREQCVAMAVAQLRKGLPYRNLLAALYLANIRTGGVDHPLAVLHSSNELSLDLPAEERLLPILWALDSFKAHYGKSSAKLKPIAGTLPPPGQAEEELHAGMTSYDGERAERAMVVLVRTQGTARIAELLWQYGARDWYFIGHQPIWAVNCWRVLETIGWQHAEPVLRVVITNIMGDRQDLQRQCYESNRELVRRVAGRLPATWSQNGTDSGFIRELLALWRESSAAPRGESPRRGEFPGGVDSRITPHGAKKRDDACELVAARLAAGTVQSGAVWDAVHLAAGEMMMCAHKGPEPGHAYTASNALHYAFLASGATETRLLILLQAVGWLFHFRENMADKGWLKQPRLITELGGSTIPDTPETAADAILADLSFGPGGIPQADPIPGFRGLQFQNTPWRHEAASKAFAFASKFNDPQSLVRAACRLLPLKADSDPHRIKFPIAAWENYGWVSPQWRPLLLAAAMYVFPSADALDTDHAQRVREALR